MESRVSLLRPQELAGGSCPKPAESDLRFNEESGSKRNEMKG
jgi:hypothetical protein